MKGELDISSSKLCNFLKESISKERRGPISEFMNKKDIYKYWKVSGDLHGVCYQSIIRGI